MEKAYAIWPWGLKKKEQMIQGIKDIKDVGFKYYESVYDAVSLFEDNVEEFKEITEHYQVYPVSFYFHQNGDLEHDVEGVREIMDFLVANDVHRMSIQGPRRNGETTREDLDYILKVLDKIGKITNDNDIIPCVHPHHGTMIMYEDEIDYIMENTDPDYIAFGPDTAHLVLGDCDPVAIFKKYVDRIKFTHIKDVDKGMEARVVEGERDGFDVYDSFVEIGQGDIDFKSILRILKENNYDGYLTIELDRSRYNHKKSAEISYNYLTSELGIE